MNDKVNCLVFLVDKTHNEGEFPYGILERDVDGWRDRKTVYFNTSELPYFQKKEKWDK